MTKPSANNPHGIKVGQVLYRAGRDGEDCSITVSRVGRKFFYAKPYGSREHCFALDTMGGYYLSKQHHIDDMARDDAVDAMRRVFQGWSRVPLKDAKSAMEAADLMGVGDIYRAHMVKIEAERNKRRTKP